MKRKPDKPDNEYVLTGLDWEGVPDDENPEWTEEDFKKAERFSDLPKELQAGLKAVTRGRPRKLDPKQPVKIRLDADLLAALRMRGKGWQTQVNAALREMVESGRL